MRTYPTNPPLATGLLAGGPNAAEEPGRPTLSRQDEWVIADPAMARLDDMVTSLAAGSISVLLTGETGTGKEMFAELIHQRSPRSHRPFVAINCAALSEGLLESELFGHERGAFTGAVRSKPGLLEAADGGTLLLDEIGEMPASLQAKLLRVLEAREVTRVGSNNGRLVDVRVVSATNRDLGIEVQQGRFRKDLYYRLCGAVLALPPLRDRLVEIAPLARMFLGRAARLAGRPIPRLSAAALERLQAHSWPGNVRELRNAMDWAVLVCKDDEIQPEHLPRGAPRPVAPDDHLLRVVAPRPPSVAVSGQALVPPLSGPGADERARIAEALERCAGNQTRAARLLGISRGTLIARLTEYGLPRPRRRRS